MNSIKENATNDLRALGLNCECVKSVESPLSYTLFFNLANIRDYNENYIKRVIEKWSVASHLDMTFEKTKEAHFKVAIKRPPQPLSLAGIIAKTELSCMAIGIDNEGYYTTIDFDKTPHLLIAGTTGAGKSTLLHNLLINICLYYAKKSRPINLFVLDAKGSEFNNYKGMSCLSYIDNTSQSIFALNWLCEEMDRRYKGTSTYPNSDIFVIIDELADLMLTSKYKVEESIVRLAQKGRACGIHLIVATQRPTIDVCTGLIKANMPTRIALKTASVRDSIVILDRKGAEQLQGYGDAILKEGSKETHFLVAFGEKELEQKVIAINKKG